MPVKLSKGSNISLISPAEAESPEVSFKNSALNQEFRFSLIIKIWRRQTVNYRLSVNYLKVKKKYFQ